MKILIAEDDATSRKLLTLTLQKMGHEVIEAEDGEQAWALFKESPVSLVITDWMMPQKTGIELCQLIRSHESNQYTFVVLLTAKEGRESYQEALDAGVDDFLSKPFKKSDIEGRLRSAHRVTQMEQKISEQNQELQTILTHIRHDLDAAARIQDSLLPHGINKIRDLEFSWSLEPCEELAGDIFNIIPLSEDETGLYLLDVSGHGVASALLSVSLSRLLSPYSDESFLMGKKDGLDSKPSPLKPSQILEKLNERFQISESSGSQYFTIFYGVYNHKSRSMTYSMAGNPPVIIRRKNCEVEEVRQQSFPIGFVPDAEFQDETLSLEKGNTAYFFSDGLFEIMNENDEIFGIENLKKEIATDCDESLNELRIRLIKNAKSWNNMKPLLDDISILLLKVSE